MALMLYAHPLSSYCQKALIAFYENDTPFQFRMLGPDDVQTYTEFQALWPLQRFPILVDGDRTILEASIIVEHLDLHYPGSIRLVPQDPKAALDVRMMDRVFDNYVSTPQQKLVFDSIRDEDKRDPHGVADALRMLDTAYGWLDHLMAQREWACGDRFTLADCAAAPSLFYADWSHPIDERFANLRAYRQRLLSRPSFARAVDEARPYRPLFPLGAPDRD